MLPLFSEAGMRRLDEIAGERVLCAFDFDGTLAPIMDKAEQVRMPAANRALLVALMAHAPVAIVTGRALADIRQRLDFAPDFVVGNHGMEGVPGWEKRAEVQAALCARWKIQLVAGLTRQPSLEGISVEDKRYSLSVHYRAAPDPGHAAALIEGVFAELEPRPRLVAGKCVVNVVPGNACHKGDALEALMQRSGARSAIYVGDDVTDEDVFRIKRSGLLSVRVGREGDSAADFYVPQADAVGRLLEELRTRLEACRARNWLRPSNGRFGKG